MYTWGNVSGISSDKKYIVIKPSGVEYERLVIEDMVVVDIETGKNKKEKSKDFSATFGEKLIELAKKNKKIVAITAAMRDGTGLKKFAEEFPDRFFDVGIAEQHALGLAAGMAKEGAIPIIPIYSSFYQRGYDQVIHDIAAQNLPVIMCVDRAGVVGQDRWNTSRIIRYVIF